MELEEKAEEVLELLWIHIEEDGKNSVPMKTIEFDNNFENIEHLLKAGYISIEDDQVRLTPAGRPLARNVVRRHRLAERLLADVLNAGDSLMHERACKFEHLLDRGLDESICTLLGHPRVCPHGKPIPPGKCCQREQKQGQRVVAALSQLNPGQSGKVAYIYAPQPEQLQKLAAMGILPGVPLNLIQAFPSYIFQAGHTQFAVDKDIAASIYVRLENGYSSLSETERPGKRRWRWGKRDKSLNTA